MFLPQTHKYQWKNCFACMQLLFMYNISEWDLIGTLYYVLTRYKKDFFTAMKINIINAALRGSIAYNRNFLQVDY